MLPYYLYLAWHGLRRSPWLSLLMVGAMGLGIGASMTELTVWHALSGDPLPARSAQLYTPYLDARPSSWTDNPGGHRAVSLTWPDAIALLQAHRAPGQAAMAGGEVLLVAQSHPEQPFYQASRFASAEFFQIFGLKPVAGHLWSSDDDLHRARVLVLTQSVAQRLFGRHQPIGQTLQLQDSLFTVIGVVPDWHPEPMFYGNPEGHVFDHPDGLFMPLTTAIDRQFESSNSLSCWGHGDDKRTGSECIWLQFWVQLNTPAQRVAYQNFLAGYWQQQLAAGRFERANHARLDGLLPWLAKQHLIPSDLGVELGLALGFLLVCLLNIIGLLLARFMRDRSEIGLRRALGARQVDIFVQLTAEAAVIGVGAGALGIALSQLGLWWIRQRPDGYAHLATSDSPMLIISVLAAVLGTLLAALIPAWRACRLSPSQALQVS